jgi:hypothetical protein
MCHRISSTFTDAEMAYLRRMRNPTASALQGGHEDIRGKPVHSRTSHQSTQDPPAMYGSTAPMFRFPNDEKAEVGTSDDLLYTCLSGSVKKAHVIAEAVTEDENGGKLWFCSELVLLHDGGTCYERAKGQRGRKYSHLHLGDNGERERRLGVWVNEWTVKSGAESIRNSMEWQILASFLSHVSMSMSRGGQQNRAGGTFCRLPRPVDGRTDEWEFH